MTDFTFIYGNLADVRARLHAAFADGASDAWQLPPPFAGNWTDVAPDAAADLLLPILQVMHQGGAHPEPLHHPPRRLRHCPLPGLVAGSRYIEVQCRIGDAGEQGIFGMVDGPWGTLAVRRGGGAVGELLRVARHADWQSPGRLLDLVRVGTALLRDDGTHNARPILIEHMTDLAWIEPLPDGLRLDLAEGLVPPRLTEEPEVWQIDCAIIGAGRLRHLRWRLAKDDAAMQLSVVKEGPVLPVHHEAWRTPFRMALDAEAAAGALADFRERAGGTTGTVDAGRDALRVVALSETEQAKVIIATATAGGNWALPPPMPGNWHDLDSEEAATLLINLSAATALPVSDPPFVLAHRLDRVRMRPLACHAGGFLLEAQGRDSDGMPRLLSFLLGPRGYALLDGTSAAIRAFNQAHGVQLAQEQQQRDYLMLFCRFVRGGDGPFEVIEAIAQLDDRLTDAEARTSVADLIRPIGIAGRDEQGRCRTTAHLLYADALFAAAFAIDADGEVAMIDDTPELHDLPIRQEGWAPPFRLPPPEPDPGPTESH